MWKKYKTYIISVMISLAVGGLSALITANNMDVYSQVITPPLSPPSILFPIVWSILYILMGIGAAMVVKAKPIQSEDVRSAISAYIINLALNFFWSILFFNFRAFLFSFIWLLALLATIIVMTVRFKKIKPIAGYLQIPYILWVAFAGYLNLGIYILN